jgi:hypothetical protein
MEWGVLIAIFISLLFIDDKLGDIRNLLKYGTDNYDEIYIIKRKKGKI